MSIYCSYCFNSLNSKDNKFFSLPCGDIFCEKCSQKLYDKDKTTKICPIDKKEIAINSIKISTYKITNLKKVEQDQNMICKLHPNKIPNYFCEDDNTFFCSLCDKNHTNHNFKKFNQNKEKFNSEISEIKNKFYEIEQKYKSNKAKAEKFFMQMKNHFDEEIHKINEYFNVMINILSEKKSKFISLILSIYEKYIKEFTKFKSIFDYANKSYSDITKNINYIDKDLYSKGDYETFYAIKNYLINDINHFEFFNENNLGNNIIFSGNNIHMPSFIYPEKDIISMDTKDQVFGSIDETDICNITTNYSDSVNNKLINYDLKNITKNIKENYNLINKNDNNIVMIEKNNNIIKDSLNFDNNTIIDNGIINTKNSKENNIITNNSKNFHCSFNSNNNSNNTSMTEKQLIETGSTIFMLNKNEVKNVFKQQENDNNNEFINLDTINIKDNSIKNFIDSSTFIKRKIKNMYNKEKINKENTNKLKEEFTIEENNTSNRNSKIKINNTNNYNNSKNINLLTNLASNEENKIIHNTFSANSKNKKRNSKKKKNVKKNLDFQKNGRRSQREKCDSTKIFKKSSNFWSNRKKSQNDNYNFIKNTKILGLNLSDSFDDKKYVKNDKCNLLEINNFEKNKDGSFRNRNYNNRKSIQTNNIDVNLNSLLKFDKGINRRTNTHNFRSISNKNSKKKKKKTTS